MAFDNNILEDYLWNNSQENYDTKDKYQDHILEQYKIYVEMADRISSRRNLANTFFLTLNSLILGAIGFSYEKIPALSNKWFLIFPLISIIALCYAWWRLVKSYRQLNTAKYLVVGGMEKKLPASPYYSAEWKALGEVKDSKLYVPLTRIENWIPIIFSSIYVAGFVYILIAN